MILFGVWDSLWCKLPFVNVHLISHWFKFLIVVIGQTWQKYYYFFIAKIYIQWNKPEMTSVETAVACESGILSMPERSCCSKKWGYLCTLFQGCARAMRDGWGGCVCLSVCFLVSCVCFWFSLEFGSVTARTSTTANFCLPHARHVHALKHTHTLPPFIPQVCLNLP